MVSTEVKKALRDSILLPTLTYGGETGNERKLVDKNTDCGNKDY